MIQHVTPKPASGSVRCPIPGGGQRLFIDLPYFKAGIASRVDDEQNLDRRIRPPGGCERVECCDHTGLGQRGDDHDQVQVRIGIGQGKRW